MVCFSLSQPKTFVLSTYRCKIFLQNKLYIGREYFKKDGLDFYISFLIQQRFLSNILGKNLMSRAANFEFLNITLIEIRTGTRQQINSIPNFVARFKEGNTGDPSLVFLLYVTSHLPSFQNKLTTTSSAPLFPSFIGRKLAPGVSDR